MSIRRFREDATIDLKKVFEPQLGRDTSLLACPRIDAYSICTLGLRR
jgi:hypothetical protein